VLRRFVLNPLEAAIAYLLLGFFRILPPDIASAIGGKVCRAIGPLTSLSHRVDRNLRIAFPEMSELERKAVAAGMWDNLGRVLAELPHMRKIRDNGYVEVVGAEHLEHRDRGKPLLFWTGHLANWEIIPSVAERFGTNIDFIYRAPNNPLVDDLLRKLRDDAGGGNLIPKGPRGARNIVRTLAHNGVIGLVIDQKMNDGIAIPFFGKEAMTAPALANLALRYECPAVPLRMERLEGTRFRLTAYPPMSMPRTGDHHADALAIMMRVNAMVEDWIRERPEQWLWVHNRWPT
jgi:Kdo2-lipid IVA lauroyltransferase/acyltransferase